MALVIEIVVLRQDSTSVIMISTPVSDDWFKSIWPVILNSYSPGGNLVLSFVVRVFRSLDKAVHKSSVTPAGYPTYTQDI